MYDLNMASRVGILSGHTGPVTSVACGDDWVLSGSSDCSIRLWQVSFFVLIFNVFIDFCVAYSCAG